ALYFFFSSRRRHTISTRDWSSDVCSSDLEGFTDYYAYRLLLQARVLSVASYIDSLNQALRRFTPSSDPYVRGRIVALWLDAKIKIGRASCRERGWRREGVVYVSEIYGGRV